MRTLHLSILAGTAAILSACGSSGVRSVGGDVFVLETANVSGARAVETGLAEAQGFCVEHGRFFVMGQSQVSADRYQMEFRCISPGNVVPGNVQAPVAVAAPLPRQRTTRRQRETAEAPRVVRGRRSVTTDTTDPIGGPAMPFAAALPPMAAPALTRPSFAPPVGGFVATSQPPFSQSPFSQAPFSQSPFLAFAAPGSSLAPPLPPVATTPLFAPAPGTTLNVAPLAAPRFPPADNSPLVALPRAEAVGVISPLAGVPRAEAVRVMSPANSSGFVSSGFVSPGQALPPVETLPLLRGQATPAAIQAQPLAPARPLSAPPANFGLVVPSQNPLPGASNSLPPIAGGSTRPLALPGNVSPGNAAPPGFWQQGR